MVSRCCSDRSCQSSLVQLVDLVAVGGLTHIICGRVRDERVVVDPWVMRLARRRQLARMAAAVRLLRMRLRYNARRAILLELILAQRCRRVLLFARGILLACSALILREIVLEGHGNDQVAHDGHRLGLLLAKRLTD